MRPKAPASVHDFPAFPQPLGSWIGSDLVYINTPLTLPPLSLSLQLDNSSPTPKKVDATKLCAAEFQNTKTITTSPSSLALSPKRTTKKEKIAGQNAIVLPRNPEGLRTVYRPAPLCSPLALSLFRFLKNNSKNKKRPYKQEYMCALRNLNTGIYITLLLPLFRPRKSKKADQLGTHVRGPESQKHSLEQHLPLLLSSLSLSPKGTTMYEMDPVCAAES
ncbi:hypothetical protein BDW02DRAFT_574801 [Decorospora gaudefroyi]|uniref:Uncharacterized protein n=1 Tax=Decorospora gaudefroyi TaxID=184978 RepID=A0A6A5JX58_9PLEO|nr:hypothetical protein BDW02DRAFT_574801 [Decorospora gaudefroyi]